MKRIAVISFLLTYLVLNIGISMKVHYCGDAISFIDFFPIEEKSCCGDVTASCCSDKLAFISPDVVQDYTSVAEVSFTDYAQYAEVNKDFSILATLISEQSRTQKFEIVHRDFLHTVPIYLRNQSFRI